MRNIAIWRVAYSQRVTSLVRIIWCLLILHLLCSWRSSILMVVMYHGVCTRIRDRRVVLSELELVSMLCYSLPFTCLNIVRQWCEFSEHHTWNSLSLSNINSYHPSLRIQEIETRLSVLIMLLFLIRLFRHDNFLVLYRQHQVKSSS